MPIVSIELLAGRSQEVKNLIAKEMTEVLVKHALVEPEHVYLTFKDIEPQNWAVAGVTFPAKTPS